MRLGGTKLSAAGAPAPEVWALSLEVWALSPEVWAPVAGLPAFDSQPAKTKYNQLQKQLKATHTVSSSRLQIKSLCPIFD